MYGDHTGDILGAIIGGLVGGICGGLSAWFSGDSGKNFWADVAQGAVSGAIGGLAADIIVLTGGTGGVVILGMSLGGFAGGALGSVAKDVVLGEGISISRALYEGKWGALIGALGGCVTGPVSAMDIGDLANDKTIFNQLKEVLMEQFYEEVKHWPSSVIDEFIWNSIAWFVQGFTEGYVQYVQQT